MTVRIFDCRGALVRELSVNKELAQGSTLAWDGTNSKGLSVAAGVYFVRFSARNFDRAIKVLLIR